MLIPFDKGRIKRYNLIAMLQGVPITAEIIPLEHDEVILGMEST